MYIVYICKCDNRRVNNGKNADIISHTHINRFFNVKVIVNTYT